MASPGSKFMRKKEEAIAALLSQRNIEEAARSIGIGNQTLLRWLKIPEFQAAYLEARRAAVAQIQRTPAAGNERSRGDFAEGYGGPEISAIHPGSGRPTAYLTTQDRRSRSKMSKSAWRPWSRPPNWRGRSDEI